MSHSPATIGLLAFILSISLVSCSGGDASSVGGEAGSGSGGEAGDTGTPIDSFPGYCTGTLIQTKEMWKSYGPGGWSSCNREAEAGTTVLLGMDASTQDWVAFAFDPDGTPYIIGNGFDNLAREDFETNCPVGPSWETTDYVLLRDSTFYADVESSGEPCTLPAGTHLTGYKFVLAGYGVAKMSADQILEMCGLETSYTSDLVNAYLIREEQPM